jgi:HSP20 family protein
MALARWTPLREMAQLQNEMNRFFSGLPTANQEELLTSSWAPQVDIYEDQDGIRLHADVPGVDQKDLDVKVENRMLTLRGERKLAQEEKKENYHRIERSYGAFTRSFMLPEYADADKVEAAFKNGVLEVKIPKREEKRPKQIKVEVK